jgi:hypothetical protein
MRRRDFMVCLGSTAAWSHAAWSQQMTMPVIGFLDTDRPGATARSQPLDDAFRAGLSEEGYLQGANVEITRPNLRHNSGNLPLSKSGSPGRGPGVQGIVATMAGAG